jgi:hypothetical protein
MVLSVVWPKRFTVLQIPFEYHCRPDARAGARNVLLDSQCLHHALLGAKDHVNVFIYDPIAPDPEGIINQGQGNSAARAIQVYKGESINRRALLNLFKAVIANNRAGGWRRLQRLG